MELNVSSSPQSEVTVYQMQTKSFGGSESESQRKVVWVAEVGRRGRRTPRGSSSSIHPSTVSMWEFRGQRWTKKKKKSLPLPQKAPLRPDRPAPRSSSFLSEGSRRAGGWQTTAGGGKRKRRAVINTGGIDRLGSRRARLSACDCSMLIIHLCSR